MQTLIDLEGPEDRPGLDMFFEVAARVYANDEVWVPESKEAFMLRYKASRLKGNQGIYPVVALAAGLPVARGAAILQKGALDKAGRPQGWLGFFEALPDYPDAARIVLNRCGEILRGAGAESVLAPKIDNQLQGLLVRGFDLPQTVLTPHNPPYYLELFKQQGYREKQKTLALYFTRETAKLPATRTPGFNTREFSRSRWQEELAIFNKLQNSIFAGRQGYVPRTLEEDRAMLQPYLPFIDDQLIIIAEDLAGKPAGLLVCLPDLNQALKGQPVNRARIISIGVLPGLEGRGIGKAMGVHLAANLLRKGYQTAEASWILEHNLPPRELAGRFNAAPGREFVLLHKTLTTA